MTQREELRTGQTVIIEATIEETRSDGDLAIDVLGISIACLAEEVQAAPQWIKFDKDDETTWPEENGSYWVSYFDEHLKRYIVASDHWASTHWLVSKREFWQPITVPSPPESNE